MRIRTAVLGLVAAGAAGCGGGNGGTDGGPCAFERHNAGATAQFHLATECWTNPWPDDRLAPGGALALPGDRFTWLLPREAGFDTARAYAQSIADGVAADADGFSTLAPIAISLDREVDLATVPQGVRFYRFDAGTPAADASVEVDATWDARLSSLLLQPRVPLAEGTTYGIVVTAQLLDPLSRPTARARDFQVILAENTPAELAALVAAADGDGISTDTIAVAFTFTTRSIAAPLVAVRDRVFGVLGSALVPSFESPSDFAGIQEGTFLPADPEFGSSLEGRPGENLGSLTTGTFETFDFRGPDGRAWDPDLVSGPSAPPTGKIPFRLTLPPGTPPVGGWPVVIVQHGLGGNDLDVFKWGNALAARGYAAIGISAVEHGHRGDVLDFFDWDSIPGTRESFRQSIADQLQLLRMMRNAASAGTPPFDQVDANDVTYFGVSLGGILGGSFLSVAPDVPRGALVVPGGHLSRELFAVEVGTSYLWPFISDRSGIDPASEHWTPFLAGFEPLVQLGLDPGDPANLGVHVVAPGTQLPGSQPRQVLMLEAEGDNWVPNEANEALRRALGIPLLASATSDVGGVSGAWRYRLDDFVGEYPDLGQEEPHGYFGLLCEAQEQVWHWIASGGTEVLDPTAVTCP